jgi:hypothetical protein
MYNQYKLGICTWSPLASGKPPLLLHTSTIKVLIIQRFVGLLTGKYNDGAIPPFTRLAIQDHPVINRLRVGFYSDEGKRKLEKIKRICVSYLIAPLLLWN